MKYTSENYHAIQQFLGLRPGGYRVDPYYLRRSNGNKPYFWDAYDKKWRDVRVGDSFDFDMDGIAIQERSGVSRNVPKQRRRAS